VEWEGPLAAAGGGWKKERLTKGDGRRGRGRISLLALDETRPYLEGGTRSERETVFHDTVRTTYEKNNV